MRDSQAATAAHLEGRITALEGRMAARGWAIDPVDTASTATVHAVGRVCGSAPGARANATALMLEGSRATSCGARVKLDTSVLQRFALFAGQVIAVRGRNPTGSCITAHEIVEGYPATTAELPRAAAAAVDNAAGPQSDCGARVIVAAGPFMPASGLACAGLRRVLEYCAQHEPDVVVLCGPFVPDEHPALLQLAVTFQELFDAQVRRLHCSHGAVHHAMIQVPVWTTTHHMPHLQLAHKGD
jgi:hypothetical protein